MFFIVGGGRYINVRFLGSGRFWCLYCETERDYEHREYRATQTFLFIPVGGWGGQFILCPACDSAFDLECLDESSTAFCEELMIQVPDRARQARLFSSRGGPGRGRDGDRGSMRWAPEPEPDGPRAGVRETLSARSSSRRH
ncbi:MAG TPA: hypothetical protein VFU73_04055 [Actinocrinis sp.]|nr:hypothetical protein [Actinocrinis sp.]